MTDGNTSLGTRHLEAHSREIESAKFSLPRAKCELDAPTMGGFDVVIGWLAESGQILLAVGAAMFWAVVAAMFWAVVAALF